MKIYKLVKNNKVIYVGSTTKKYLNSRLYDHKYYGKDIDYIELIEETNDRNREKYWINYHDTFNNGLNKTKSGYGGNLNPKKARGISNEVNKKQIRVWNENGFDQIFISLSEAATILGLNKSSLSKVANNKRNSVFGYHAEYIEKGMMTYRDL